MARLGPAAAGGTVRETDYELALFIIRNDPGAKNSLARPYPQDLVAIIRDHFGGLKRAVRDPKTVENCFCVEVLVICGAWDCL